MENLKYSKDQFIKANTADIVTYLTRKGYTCECEGENLNKQYKFPELDALSINTAKANRTLFYFHKRKQGGCGAVKCLMQARNISFESAIAELLNGEAPTDKDGYSPDLNRHATKRSDYTYIAMPPRADQVKRVYAYLIRDCGISATTIRKLIKENYLYQDEKGNAVFVVKRDGEIFGGDIRGTLKGRKYQSRVRNTFDDFFEYPLSENPKTAYVFKDVIDLMRFLDAHTDLDGCTLVAMDGLVDNVIANLEKRDLDIVLCLENAGADAKFSEKHVASNPSITTKPLDDALGY